MIYWSWGTGRRLAAVAAMLGLSTVIVLIGAWFDRSWLTLSSIVGGVSFLTLPQIMVWMLFVGFRTGFIPQRGRRVWCLTSRCTGQVLTGVRVSAW